MRSRHDRSHSSAHDESHERPPTVQERPRTPRRHRASGSRHDRSNESGSSHDRSHNLSSSSSHDRSLVPSHERSMSPRYHPTEYDLSETVEVEEFHRQVKSTVIY